MGYSLLFDLGNTAIKIGLEVKGRLKQIGSLPVFGQSVDDLGQALVRMTRQWQADAPMPEICLAASVVPGAEELLKAAIKKYFGSCTLFAGVDFEIPLANEYERPSELGADRIAAAYGARVALPDLASIIVVDFGTAVTFDCISGNAFLGGMIFPGPEIALAALAEKAARLPRLTFDVELAKAAPGRTTATCIRNGLVFGYAGMTHTLCDLLMRQLPKPCGIIAAGGFAEAIGSVCNIFDSIRPGLVLEGLAAFYRLANNNKRS